METTSESAATELFLHIPLEALTASRTQPKKRKADQDLVESVREHGVVTPGLARPTPDGPTAYEVVFGHRRWDASVQAERDSMPFIVRELSDAQALELQLVENLRREDLHPLDEAEGYEVLHREHDYTVEDIAAKIGKSKAYVYARMKLLALQTEGREAFRAGELEASVALYLARVPGTLQGMALKDLRARGGHNGDRISARTAAWLLQERFMLQLGTAPFDVGDAELVAAAGACTGCVKKTGNQRELFADVESADVCTDPVCYRTKVDALWQIKSKAAKKGGAEVMSAEEAKKLWPHGSNYMQAAAWVDLKDPCYSVSGSKPYKTVLAKAMPPIVLARDPDGGVHELVKRTAAEKALLDLGVVKKDKNAPDSRVSPEQKKKDRARLEKSNAARDLAEKVTAAAIAAVVDIAERGLKRSVLVAAVQELASGACHATEKRRGIKPGKLQKNIPGMTDAGLHGLLVELAIFPDGVFLSWDGKISKGTVDACKAFGVDLKAIEKGIKDAAAAADKLPAEMRAHPTKKKGKK